MTVKVGVIGVGTMGKHHARVFSQLNGAELVGVSDLDDERAGAVADEYGCDVVRNVEDLLEEVDAVSVAVPTRYHHDTAAQALESGCHVLVEKPITGTVEDALDLKARAEEAGLIVQVGHIERFNPVFDFLKSVIEEEGAYSLSIRRLGPFSDRVSRDSVAFDLMIHDLDIVMALFGEYPTEVSAMGAPCKSETLDYASAILKFSDGCIANVEASHMSHEKVRDLAATTSDSYIVANYQEQSVSIYKSGVSGFTDDYSGGFRTERVVEKPYLPHREPLMGELQHFVDCVERGQEPRVGIDDGINALKLANEIDEICMTGR